MIWHANGLCTFYQNSAPRFFWTLAQCSKSKNLCLQNDPKMKFYYDISIYNLWFEQYWAWFVTKIFDFITVPFVFVNLSLIMKYITSGCRRQIIGWARTEIFDQVTPYTHRHSWLHALLDTTTLM